MTSAESERAAVVARSNRREVRNPILALPNAARIDLVDPGAREALRLLLLDIRSDAQQRAAECWRKHKAPMAAYWKAVAVYSGHIAKVLKTGDHLKGQSDG